MERKQPVSRKGQNAVRVLVVAVDTVAPVHIERIVGLAVDFDILLDLDKLRVVIVQQDDPSASEAGDAVRIEVDAS